MQNEKSEAYGVVGSKNRATWHHVEPTEMSHFSLLILVNLCSLFSILASGLIPSLVIFQRTNFGPKENIENKLKHIRVIPVTEKRSNICIIDMPEEKRERTGTREYCKKEFPNTRKIRYHIW